MKIISILIICIIVLLTGALIFFNMAPQDMRDDVILIKKGEPLSHAANSLKEKNLIKNEKFFVLLAFLENKSNIISGKYKINSGMSTSDIIKKLSDGEIIRRKVTIPEGFNLYQIAERLEENEITDKVEFLKYSFDEEFLKSMNLKHQSIEGLIFPDTYLFAESQEAKEIIMIMHKQYKNIISSIDFSNMKKFRLNTYEIINLASLIEEEAKVPKEREYISSVFHNRLKKNMKLGCDPTVRYAVKKFKARLTYKDLKHDSPYNTYLYRGLPPTPICSPGKEAINAALHPVDSDYLYFVARNDGSHYFSKTAREHTRAVEFYQKGIKNGFVDKQKL